MKLLLLLIYLLGAYGIEVLGPQQVELLPDENLQPQMNLKPRLQLDPARPADRAKKRSEDSLEKWSSRSQIKKVALAE